MWTEMTKEALALLLRIRYSHNALKHICSRPWTMFSLVAQGSGEALRVSRDRNWFELLLACTECRLRSHSTRVFLLHRIAQGAIILRTPPSVLSHSCRQIRKRFPTPVWESQLSHLTNFVLQ